MTDWPEGADHRVILATVMRRRIAAGLAVRFHFPDRPEPFTRYYVTEAQRDRHMAEAERRGIPAEIIGGAS